MLGTGRVWGAVRGRRDEDPEGGQEQGAPEGPNTGVCVISPCGLGLGPGPAEGVKWWGRPLGCLCWEGLWTEA